MLYQRNVVMTDRFFKIIQEKSIFCAIGAGHLGGKQGVLRLLKQRGLTVKEVVSSRQYAVGNGQSKNGKLN